MFIPKKGTKVYIRNQGKEVKAMFHSLSRKRGYAYITDSQGKNFRTVRLEEIN